MTREIENASYDIHKTIETVNIPNSLYKSIQGKYFVGQTNALGFGDETYAWGGLINPENSRTNLYVNVFTVTNLGNKELTSEVWLDSTPVGKPHTSKKVSTTNTVLYPTPIPRIRLEYGFEVFDKPFDGTNIFNRIIPSGNTIVAEEDGKYIIRPGSTFIIFLNAPKCDAEAIVAFGWCEEKCR